MSNKNNNEDYMNEFEEGTVTLSLDDGKEVECGIVAVFPVGEQDYIALLPLNDEDAADGEVYLYQYFEDENGEPSLGNIRMTKSMSVLRMHSMSLWMRMNTQSS